MNAISHARESSVDLASLPASYPMGVQLHEAPAIWVFKEFAGTAEIAALLDAARDKLAPAEVSGNNGGYISKGRSGSNCWISHDHNALTLALAQRVSELVQIPLINAENFQVVHYTVHQEYQPHFDCWDAGTERGDRCMERGGQRLVTTLLYLNDVAGGGSTRFPTLDLDVQPAKGTLLLFHNCEPGTITRHENSLHAGMPVISGEKWAANLWFRQRDYRWKG